MSKQTGAQILWECLVREGVTDVFGYPGGAILPAYDAMLAYPIRHILSRHEQGATHMADGYARGEGLAKRKFGQHVCITGGLEKPEPSARSCQVFLPSVPTFPA